MMALAVATLFFFVFLCPLGSFAQGVSNPCFLSDIGFILDMSPSISEMNFRRSKTVIQGLTNAFEVKPGGSRAGLIIFGTRAATAIEIGQYETAYEFNEKIRNLDRNSRSYSSLLEGGLSYLNRALEKATSELFGRRYREPFLKVRVLYVLSDGKQTGNIKLKLLTRALRHFRVRIIAIAVGDRPHMGNLRQLVVKPLVDVVVLRTQSNIKRKVQKLHYKGCSERQPAFIKQCSKRIDLGFALDASGSIGKRIFQKVKKFTTDLVRKFQLSPTETHAGVIVYSTVPKMVIKMNEIYELDKFASELSRRTPWPSRRKPLQPKWMDGYTRIDEALKMAKEKLFTVANGDRPDVRDALIFLTDGKQKPPAAHELGYYSRPLKDAKVTIVAVGFGAAEKKELKKIASAPELVLSYKGGVEVLEKAVQDIVEKLCNFCQKRVNLGFVLDASRTTEKKFKGQKDLVLRIVEGFSVGQNGSQATLVTFSNKAEVEIGFTSSLESFKIDLGYVESKGRSTYIDKGLRKAGKEFSNFAYKDAPKILLVMTDGRQTGDSKVVREAADTLRKNGFTIFAIATSKTYINKNVLKYIAGEEENIMYMENRYTRTRIKADLRKLASRVVNKACPEKTLEPEKKKRDEIDEMMADLLEEM